jgi:hypothetical protein
MVIHLKHPENFRQWPLGCLSKAELKALSKSEFAANILFAKKSDGRLRLCCDYHSLNSKTIRDQTPLVSHTALHDRVQGANFLTKIDIRDAFHSILVHEEDRHKTAFKTEFGLFKFTVCPFGLANSPATFICMMNRIFNGCKAFLIHYFDHILIFSNSFEDHLTHIAETLQWLKDNKLFIKLL